MNNEFLEHVKNMIKNESFTNLQVIRSIINSEWTRKEEEYCASLNIRDILEFEKDGKIYMGVVSKINNKTINVIDNKKNTWSIQCSEIRQKITLPNL